jgi:hypothetical protein
MRRIRALGPGALGDYWLSPCARAAIDTYLVTKLTPPQGTHCPAVFPTAPGQPPGSAGDAGASADPLTAEPLTSIN